MPRKWISINIFTRIVDFRGSELTTQEVGKFEND